MRCIRRRLQKPAASMVDVERKHRDVGFRVPLARRRGREIVNVLPSVVKTRDERGALEKCNARESPKDAFRALPITENRPTSFVKLEPLRVRAARASHSLRLLSYNSMTVHENCIIINIEPRWQ